MLVSVDFFRPSGLREIPGRGWREALTSHADMWQTGESYFQHLTAASQLLPLPPSLPHSFPKTAPSVSPSSASLSSAVKPHVLGGCNRARWLMCHSRYPPPPHTHNRPSTRHHQHQRQHQRRQLGTTPTQPSSLPPPLPPPWRSKGYL